ncbi:MAG TPA: FAD-binding oxidoreductase [Acidimicrobiales bacterium]|nr:FAD-binding oxidoreductase [Acidimicrobiales bacterium]
MAEPGSRVESPSSAEVAGEIMGAAGEEKLRVRMRGGGTKLSWGNPPSEPADLEVSTERLDEVVEHNEGDLTAVLQAGVPLARAQQQFAEANQMIALDPWLGEDGEATIGGVIATADSGPLRHRYGAARDLILGITFVLSDGTVAKAGSKVIKNVAGYDLAKLFTGSYGTLGLIVQVVMRLHPLAANQVTALGASDDPDAVGRAASAVAHSPFGAEALDVAWAGGHGEVMARFGGAAPEATAQRVVEMLRDEGLEEARHTADDEGLWERQRERQRSTDGVVVKVSGLASELPKVLRAAEAARASLVGRAGQGLSWISLPAQDTGELVAAVEDLRRRLQPFPCVVLDTPSDVREKVDVWGEEGSAVPLMRRVKERFDPQNVCNPGIFVGGI